MTKQTVVKWMFPVQRHRYSLEYLVNQHRPSVLTDFIFALEQAVEEGYINRELWVLAHDGTKLEVHTSIQTVPVKIKHPKTGKDETITPDMVAPHFYRT